MAKKFILFGKEFSLLDDDLPVEFVDMVTELRYARGVAYLSFATTVEDQGEEGSPPVLRPKARVRFTLEQAEALYNGLGKLIAHAKTTQGKAVKVN